MDYSYPADIPMEKTIYWSSFMAMCGNNESLAKQCFETHTNPYFRNQHNIDLVWNLYHNVLFSFINPIVSLSLEDALSKYCA
jgi:hypothetical protein